MQEIIVKAQDIYAFGFPLITVLYHVLELQTLPEFASWVLNFLYSRW